MSNGTLRGLPPQIILPGQQQVIQAFEFDGFVFPTQVKADQIAIVEIAYRARRGDVSATAVLNGFGVNLKDLRGESYWPMKTESIEPFPLPDPPGGES